MTPQQRPSAVALQQTLKARGAGRETGKRTANAGAACCERGGEYLGVMTPADNILLVEDSRELVSLLQRALGERGYRVRAARDAESARGAALEHAPDLVILDVGLPDGSGFDLLRELRHRGFRAPVMMLTARGDIADRVTGLEAGADDYLAKPFDCDELIARVRALLRRAPMRSTRICVGELALDPVTREVKRGARRLALTQREFSLLEFLMRNAGRTVSRSAILREVWREGPVDVDETNIVDVYVAYLRKKLDGENEEPLLQTVRGIGYRLRSARAED